MSGYTYFRAPLAVVVTASDADECRVFVAYLTSDSCILHLRGFRIVQILKIT
jgi:hypothetical protein